MSNMPNKRLTWVILALGLLFVVNPLYWDLLAQIGVDVYLDWLANIGYFPPGMYYRAIGGMYLLAGVLALRFADEDERDVRQVGLGVAVSLLVVWAGLLAFWWPPGGELVSELGFVSIAFASGTGPVLVGLLIGATADRSTTWILWGIAVLLLLPFVSVAVAGSMAQGGPTTLGGMFSLLGIVFLIILDTIWGYPLYRLGRSLG